MNLFKTSALNAIAVGARLLTTLGLNKVLAVAVGPEGYALMGQFQNAVSMIMTFATGAINTGVTKYTAEYGGDESRQRLVWRTAGTIASIGTAIAAGLVVLFHRRLAAWFLHDENYGGVFLWFAFTLGLFVLNALLLAILNGRKEIRRYVTVNIAGSVVALIVTALLALRWGVHGALVALAINQSIVVIVTIGLCWRTPWFRWPDLWGRIDPEVARNLFKYTLMALTTAVVAPLSQLLIRDHLATTFDWQAAGHWQAVTRISDLYLMVITGTLSLYYLPRLSEIRLAQELRAEILHGYRYILPVAFLGAATIFLLRDWITATLFARSFAPMQVLFGWQLAGDVMKIGGWLLGYVALAQSMTKVFIMGEIAFSSLLVGLTWWLTQRHGLVGVSMAYCLTYAAYWLTMIFVIRSKLNRMTAPAAINVS